MNIMCRLILGTSCGDKKKKRLVTVINMQIDSIRFAGVTVLVSESPNLWSDLVCGRVWSNSTILCAHQLTLSCVLWSDRGWTSAASPAPCWGGRSCSAVHETVSHCIKYMANQIRPRGPWKLLRAAVQCDHTDPGAPALYLLAASVASLPGGHAVVPKGRLQRQERARVFPFLAFSEQEHRGESWLGETAGILKEVRHQSIDTLTSGSGFQVAESR